jgi:hypothetical protein
MLVQIRRIPLHTASTVNLYIQSPQLEYSTYIVRIILVASSGRREDVACWTPVSNESAQYGAGTRTPPVRIDTPWSGGPDTHPTIQDGYTVLWGPTHASLQTRQIHHSLWASTHIPQFRMDTPSPGGLRQAPKPFVRRALTSLKRFLGRQQEVDRHRAPPQPLSDLLR